MSKEYKVTELAVSYERVSTDEQAKEGFSLEAQRDRNRAYIADQKWHFVRSYVDPGKSGKNLKRPDMQLLLKDLQQGSFNTVVVHKLDRLTRNIGDLYYLLNLFDKHNIKLVSITENIVTSTAMGRMFVFMLGIFAQWYRENLAEEVRKGMSTRVDNGLKIVSVPMYGYTFDEDHNLIVQPEEAKWVKRIFDRYLEGIGSTNIAKELNDMGIRRSQGALWDQHKVMLTLHNYHYIGQVHWKAADVPESERIIRQGEHEPIIEPEQFDQVQRILHRRSEGLMSRNSYEYVFSGIVKCSKCGSTYKGKYTKRNLKNGEEALWRSYECSNNARYGTCDQGAISELKLTALLFKEVVANGDESFMDTFVAEQSDEESKEREELLSSITQSESRRERWQMAFGDGMMTQKDFYKRMEAEMLKIKEWEERLENLPLNVSSTVTADEVYKTFMRMKDEWEYFDQNVKKQIIQSFFQRIEIIKHGKVWEIKDMVLA